MSVWNEPDGLTPRGTVIVLAGRGEAADVYERFGRRIAADAWRVRVVTDAAADVAGATERVQALLDDADLPAPRVLVGSDVGAALVLRLAADGLPIAGAVVAGVPTAASHRLAGAEHELRSACPVHRRTLDDESLVTPGALDLPVPPELLGVDPTSVAIPVLALHGEADPVVAADDALRYLAGLPDVEVAVVRGALHDVLNDLPHRSVAATIVLFLERLKAGHPLVDTVVVS